MKILINKIISSLLCAVMIVTMLPLSVFAEDAAAEQEEIVLEAEIELVEETEEEQPSDVAEVIVAETEDAALNTVEEDGAEDESEGVAYTTFELSAAPESDLPENDALFAGYVEQLFYGNSISMFSSAAGSRLTGDDKLIYDALVPIIKQIANGERASTVIGLGQEISYGGVYYGSDADVTFTISALTGDSLDCIIDALLADLPYEMYWYDKTTGCGVSGLSGSTVVNLQFSFAVAGNYAGSSSYAADTAKTGAAAAAVENADSIISQYASATDYGKLVGYKNAICDLVEYDWDAAEGGYYNTNDDPWQMINVFDGNTATNVVCEGYSKAFMYLCDMTDFAGEVSCYTVTGTMSGGGHMWNIVTLNGKNYMVDVTNSDSSAAGCNGGMFLVGGSGSPSTSYVFLGYTYIYDSDTTNLWGVGSDSILNLAASAYESTCITHTEVTLEAKEKTCTENGLTEGVYCSTCQTDLVKQEVIPAGHEWTEGAVVEATNQTAAEVEYECIDCGETKSEQLNISKPVPVAAVNEGTTVVFSWKAVEDEHVAAYRVYRKLNGAKNWEVLADYVEETQYVDDSADSGKKYVYTVSCVAENGLQISGYNTTGKSVSHVAQPEAAEPENTASGIKLSWNKVSGAAKYRVYLRKANGTWSKVTDTSKTYYTYTKAKNNREYTFTVAALNKSGKVVSTYNNEGVTIEFVSAPVLGTVKNLENGVEFTWKAVNNDSVTDYAVLRKVSGGDWETIYTAGRDELSYVDNTAEGGVKYTYTVQAVGEPDSGYNTSGKSITRIEQPKLNALENTSSGVRVSWDAAESAYKYRVYRLDDGEWEKVTDTSKTYYTYTKAKNGTEYTFTVAALNKSGKVVSTYNNEGVTIEFVSAPVLGTVKNLENGVEFTWKAVNNDSVTDYAVLRKVSGGDWETIYTAGRDELSYVDNTAEGGVKYTYTVQAVGEPDSGYNTNGKSITRVEQPNLNTPENTAGGIKLSWDKVAGASKYRVYLQKANGTWSKVTDTSKTYYTYTKAKNGASYTFTVAALDKNGKEVSTYNKTGVSAAFLSAPTLVSANCTAEGILFSWKAVNAEGAQYQIYRKADGVWQPYAVTTELSYLDTDVYSGEKYYYTVAVTDANGVESGKNESGKSATFYTQAKIENAENAASGIKLSWSKADGIYKYRVQLKSGSKWKTLTTTAGSSYTYTKAKDGKSYTFRLQAVNKSGDVIGTYDAGVTVTFELIKRV